MSDAISQSEHFSLLICLDVIKFMLLSLLICLKICCKSTAMCCLETPLLKRPNKGGGGGGVGEFNG